MKSSLLSGLLALCLWPALSFAQSPRFVATTDSRQALLNDYIEVSFSLHNADGSNFKPPRFTDVKVISGPNTAVQTSIINGTVSKVITYTFALQPTRKGKLVIPPASMQVGGRTLQTQPLTIEVLDARPASDQDSEVFIRAEISAQSAYVGQQLLLDYKLYTSKEVESLNLVSEDTYEGFFASEVRQFDTQFVREVVKGRAYFTRILKRMALYPQQQGKLTIDPLSVQMNVPIGDDFTGGFFTQRPTRRVPASTQPIVVDVRPLPQPQPADFTGGVGVFTLESSANPTTLTTDDAITLKLNIVGQGDIKRISAPTLNLGDTFEVYEPKVLREEYFEYPDRVEGIKELEYLIVPKQAGAFTLHPQMTYFSTQTQSYQTLQATAYPIEVRQGSQSKQAAAGDTGLPDGPQGFQDATQQLSLSRAAGRFWASPLFWSLAIIPLISLAGLWVYGRAADQRDQIDPVLLKQQRARQQALQRLQQAASYQSAGDSRAFYNEVSRALLGYVSDKLHIPPSELSKSNVQQRLQSLAVTELLVKRFLALMQTCEMALFAGQAQTDAMASTYQEAVGVLADVEESLK